MACARSTVYSLSRSRSCRSGIICTPSCRLYAGRILYATLFVYPIPGMSYARFMTLSSGYAAVRRAQPSCRPQSRGPVLHSPGLRRSPLSSQSTSQFSGYIPAGVMVRRIQELRLAYSVHEVLEMILPDLPRCVGDLASSLLVALLAHDVYNVTDLDYISGAVGMQPNAFTWSIMIHNAIHSSNDIQAAIDVYVEACRRGFRVRTSATNQLIGHLVNARKFYQPDPSSIRRAVAIFLQQISTEDEDDSSYVEAFPLLRALASSTAVPDRDTHIRRILDWMKLRKLPINLDKPHLDPIISACLRCQSYSAAVSSVSTCPGLSPADLKSLLGTIVRMRFAGETFMPLSDFAAFTRYWEACGYAVDTSVILTYLAGLRVTLHALCLPWELLVPRKSGSSPASVLRELRCHVHAFEAYVVERYPEAVDVQVYTALLYLLPTLRSYDVQLFDHLWSAIKRKIRPLSSYTVSAALEAAWTFDQVEQIWADYLDSGASPSNEAWTAYSDALLYFRRYERAFAVLTEHIGDDPEHATGAIALFGRAPSPEDLRRYAAALPRTWADTKVQYELTKYRDHRARLGRVLVSME